MRPLPCVRIFFPSMRNSGGIPPVRTKEKGGRESSSPLRTSRNRTVTLGVVVQGKLVRMRAQTQRIKLFRAFVLDPGLDHIRGEHIALEQERMIFFQRRQRPFKRTRD